MPEINKKERYAKRKALIDNGKKSENPSAKKAAERLERNNTAVERAKLADHVYQSDQDPPPPAPEGWKQLDDKDLAKLGLKKDDLVDSKTGLKAAIYQSDFESPPKTVLSFAGTEDGTDWEVNAAQGVGKETKQYTQAMELSSHLSNTLGPDNVEITGHSLGGGLASAGSVVTGSKASTFNAAGLNPKTVERLGFDKEMMDEGTKNVDAFYSSSDPLNKLQDNIPGMKEAAGNRHEVSVAPDNQHGWKDVFRHPIKTALDGHGSGTMVANIENEKKEDEKTIENAIL